MRIFLLIISLLFPCGLIAQITLSGRVVSVQQQPLQGVTVVDKISGKWAFTNDKGEFSISVYKEYDLSFTMLGLQSQTIKGTATLTHSIFCNNARGNPASQRGGRNSYQGTRQSEFGSSVK